MKENISNRVFSVTWNKVYKGLEKYTVPLLNAIRGRPQAQPQPNSTSVLINQNGRYFLVTTGHSVVNENLNEFGFMIESSFFAVGNGNLKCFEPNDPEKCHIPNKVDIAVWKLDKKASNILKAKYEFLEIGKIELNHYSTEESCYLILGYPAKTTRMNTVSKKIIPSTLQVITKGVAPSYYLSEDIDIDLTLVLKGMNEELLNPKGLIRERIPSELGGISGCGIWHLHNLYSGTPKCSLVGILKGIDFEKEVIYATKIDIVNRKFMECFH